jgi:hypothetical protein
LGGAGGAGGPSLPGAGGAAGRAGGRTPTTAPDSFPPDDWILFQCPDCAGAEGVRAVRCDGSAEILLGRPTGSGEITGARLTAATVAVSVRSGSGWEMWARLAGAWQQVPLGATSSSAATLMGGPHLEAAFSGGPEPATRVFYARSYDSGTDAVSYLDVTTGKGWDILGQALPQVDDLEIQFTLLGDGRLAVYQYSPSNQAPGDQRQLWIVDPASVDEAGFALEKPDQIAGLRDGGVAVLRGGTITTYAADGAIRGVVTGPATVFPGPVTAIATVDAGPLAFSSHGDLYCARSAGDIVRLTDTPEEEQLFP